MKLFLISQKQNFRYDAYDSAVVVASNEEAARNIDPSNGRVINWNLRKERRSGYWCDSPDHVTVLYLGEAAPDIEQYFICASFNAG